MALDAQRNWTVAMESRTNHFQQKETQRSLRQLTSSAPHSRSHTNINKPSLHLPSEIIVHILEYVPRNSTSQPTLHACALVSRLWYSATIPFLYHSPHIKGKSFQQFVRTVCPSINAHIRKSELAEFVRVLDMGNLVHDGSRSLTARLLGRVKGHLEVFVAPQASFA